MLIRTALACVVQKIVHAVTRKRSELPPPLLFVTTLPEALYPVVLQAYNGGFKLKSNFAREYAGLVAAAACEGYITTATPDGCFGDIWRVTEKGLAALYSRVHQATPGAVIEVRE